MTHERPWWPKSLHQVSVLAPADHAEDKLSNADFVAESQSVSGNSLHQTPQSNVHGLALRWSAFWMIVSRKASKAVGHLSHALPAVVPASALDRLDDGSRSRAHLTKSERKQLAAQKRAAMLAKARAKEHAASMRRNARLAGLTFSTALSLLLVCATPSLPSLPAYSDLRDGENYVYLTPMDLGSNVVATFTFEQPVHVSSGALITQQINLRGTALQNVAKRDETGQTVDQDTDMLVNRATKGDLLMTRQPALAADPNPDLPYSGRLFELEDIFSALNEDVMPRTALAAPGWPSQDQIDLATNHFHAPEVRMERTRTMVAEAEKAAPTAPDAPLDTQRTVALAYAPVQNMDEFKSPFAVVLNMPNRAPAYVDPETNPARSTGHEIDPAAPVLASAPSTGETITDKDVGVANAAAASLVTASLPSITPKAAPAASEVTIAGRIPLARPAKIPNASNDADITTVSVIRPKLAPGDHAWARNKLPRSSFSRKQQRCLAAAIYFEARGEPAKGQAAVAQVVLNRVKNPAYPSSICGVVYQNKSWRNRCQFSFACDGIRDRVRDKGAYAEAVKIAKSVTRGKTWLRSVGSSTHYHATYVRPKWARSMKRMTKIGRHIFFRTYGGGWS